MLTVPGGRPGRPGSSSAGNEVLTVTGGQPAGWGERVGGRSTRGLWCLLFPGLPVGVLGAPLVFWESCGAWGGQGCYREPGAWGLFCKASGEPGRLLGSLEAWRELGGVLGSESGAYCPRWPARSVGKLLVASHGFA